MSEEIVKDWFVSTATAAGNTCVQARVHADGSVDIRNSKRPEGEMLTFDREEWAAFVEGVLRGEFTIL